MPRGLGWILVILLAGCASTPSQPPTSGPVKAPASLTVVDGNVIDLYTTDIHAPAVPGSSTVGVAFLPRAAAWKPWSSTTDPNLVFVDVAYSFDTPGEQVVAAFLMRNGVAELRVAWGDVPSLAPGDASAGFPVIAPRNETSGASILVLATGPSALHPPSLDVWLENTTGTVMPEEEVVPAGILRADAARFASYHEDASGSPPKAENMTVHDGRPPAIVGAGPGVLDLEASDARPTSLQVEYIWGDVVSAAGWWNVTMRSGNAVVSAGGISDGFSGCPSLWVGATNGGPSSTRVHLVQPAASFLQDTVAWIPTDLGAYGLTLSPAGRGFSQFPFDDQTCNGLPGPPI